jgi:cell division protein FtsZ
MAINVRIPEHQELKPRILVFGIGGAGGNAVNNMMLKNLEGAEFVAANTDAQALQQSNAQTKLQLGLKSTQGLGAGAKPEVGNDAAVESSEQIADILEGANLCFITAGMGGGTGTGAAPIVADLARQKGILTVGVVTKPFQFEGSTRMRQADEGIAALQKVVDTLIIIPNQNLFRLATEKTTFTEAFSMADDVLYQGVKGVTDLMVKPGLINLDFADVRSIMDEMGKAMMGTGEASGEDRALQAAEKAIANPLLDEISLKGATGVLINVTGSSDMTLFEVDEAANRIRDEVDPEANIIVGSTFDTDLTGSIRVSVVATGIDVSEFSKPKPEPKELVEETNETLAKDIYDQGYFQKKAQPDNEIKDEMSQVDSEALEEHKKEFVAIDSNINKGTLSPIGKSQSTDNVESRDGIDSALGSISSEKTNYQENKSSESTSSGRGLNNLIRRMTGFGEKRSEPESNEVLPIQSDVEKQDLVTEREDESKLEIPAFLRRQAN